MISQTEQYSETSMATSLSSRLRGLRLDAAVKQNAFIGVNLGRDTLLMKVPLSQFIEISRVANDRTMGDDKDAIAQRELDRAHASRLAVYVLKGVVTSVLERAKQDEEKKMVSACEKILKLLGTQPYLALQPIVANLREYDDSRLEESVQKNAMGDVICLRVPFGPGDLLFIVDGQHRLVGMQIMLEFLRSVVTNQIYPKRGNLLGPVEDRNVPPDQLRLWQECLQMALSTCTVAVECHVNLSPKEEKQLFHDLNNLGKRVAAGLAFDFDESNPVNQFIKKALVQKILSDWEVVERDIVDWDQGTVEAVQPQFARKDLVAVNAVLFLNKTNVRTARPEDVESMREVAERFWQAIARIKNLDKADAKLKTVAAQPVVLKALAKLTYDFASGRAESAEHLDTLLKAIPSFDFSHGNKLWQYYQMPAKDREKAFPGLAAYLPPQDEGNRDLGAVDTFGRMRFGAKHNDIFPILADMIRWKLKLPNRRIEAI
jgi:hypothetical protein